MSNQKGFTLIEIAIVLVIIGLLLGGVLKGRTFIDSAKTKNVNKQAESLTAAIYGYQDRYSYFPGDDSTASNRWATTDGNGNGQIAGTEYQYAPQHLAQAGLITGTYDGTNFITHRYGGNIRITYANIGGHGNGNLIRFDNVPASCAESLDKSLDDGVFNTGSVVSATDYNSANPDSNVAQTAYYF